jgi:hypothetical protein
VVLFNYRGYGRSTGSPTPARNAADLAALVQALKQAGGRHNTCHNTQPFNGHQRRLLFLLFFLSFFFYFLFFRMPSSEPLCCLDS